MLGMHEYTTSGYTYIQCVWNNKNVCNTRTKYLANQPTKIILKKNQQIYVVSYVFALCDFRPRTATRDVYMTEMYNSKLWFMSGRYVSSILL